VKRFDLARRALADLQDIWEHISENSFVAADRVLEEFYQTFERLAETPQLGHKRPDLTPRDVLFWPVHSYLVIYKDSKPLRIIRVVHGRRDVKRLHNKR
jgi:plasmid stabilization system protein ParE